MKKMGKDIIAIIAGSLYLLLYAILIQFDGSRGVAVIMFMFSPFVVIWVAYSVLRFGIYKGPELGKDEFAYLDKKKEDLGTF